jgi:long-chain-fatty-acid--CoA ligase ACSBG
VDNAAQLAKILAVQDSCHDLRWIVMWGSDIPTGADRPSNLLSWEEFLARGDSDEHDDLLQNRLDYTKPGNCAFLSYTSGTTGPPKAVMLSHDACIVSTRNLCSVIPFGPDERAVCYLPLSHIAGAIDMIACAGASLTMNFLVHFAFPDALQGSLVTTLRDVRPTILSAVPRVLEKLQAGLTAGLVAKGLGEAVRQGTLTAALQEAGIPGSAILAQVGLEQVAFLTVGAAPIQISTLEFFQSLRLTIHELYGMTENCAFSHRNTKEATKFGSVGRDLKQSQSMLAHGTHEILTRSRCTMMGYMYDPEKTAETIDADGWLHTGDIGKFDEDGYLFIVGRIKELMISAGGENMAPVILEAEVKKQLPAISNVIMIGDRQKFVVALLTLKQKPNGELDGEALAVDSSCTTVEQARSSEIWQAYIDAGITAANKNSISRAQETRKFAVLPSDFSFLEQPGNPAELTPTLKLKRNVVHKKFVDVIKAQYGDEYVECGW